MQLSTILAILSIISIIVGFLIQYFAIITKIKERLREVEIKSDLFWKIVETELPRLIHSPHTPELDKLLENFEDNTLNECGAQRLMDILRNERDNGVDMGRKLAIVLLMARIEQKFRGFVK